MQMLSVERLLLVSMITHAISLCRLFFLVGAAPLIFYLTTLHHPSKLSLSTTLGSLL